MVNLYSDCSPQNSRDNRTVHKLVRTTCGSGWVVSSQNLGITHPLPQVVLTRFNGATESGSCGHYPPATAGGSDKIQRRYREWLLRALPIRDRRRFLQALRKIMNSLFERRGRTPPAHELP